MSIDSALNLMSVPSTNLVRLVPTRIEFGGDILSVVQMASGARLTVEIHFDLQTSTIPLIGPLN